MIDRVVVRDVFAKTKPARAWLSHVVSYLFVGFMASVVWLLSISAIVSYAHLVAPQVAPEKFISPWFFYAVTVGAFTLTALFGRLCGKEEL